MPESLRALIVILALSLTVFFVATRPQTGLPIASQDLLRRCGLWIGITIVAFLAHNFWLYVAALALLLMFTASRERNPLALFVLLLFALPMFPVEIAGFAGINQLFSLTHPRALALIILLPAALTIRRSGNAAPLGSLLVDKLLLLYLVYQFGLELRVDTLTNTIRHSVFYVATDVVLPYYVASRALRTLPQFRDTMTMFVLAVMVMSAIAIFEFLRSWLLYDSVKVLLGAKSSLTAYLQRGDHGPLRAMAAAGHPIVLGYLATIAGLFYLYLKRSMDNPLAWRAGAALLAAGLIVPLSRGPWVGALAAGIVLVATGPKALGRLAQLTLMFLVVFSLVLLTPYGDRVIDLLPWIGKEGSYNVTYRERLLAVSLEVIALNPFLGSFDFMRHPLMQTMRQGEGIIDIVNTYLGVALAQGLVGLALFAAIFLAALARVALTLRALPTQDSEAHLLGRVLAAALIGALLIIVTVSAISTVPLVLWLLTGLLVGYREMLAGVVQSARGRRQGVLRATLSTGVSKSP